MCSTWQAAAPAQTPSKVNEAPCRYSSNWGKHSKIILLKDGNRCDFPITSTSTNKGIHRPDPQLVWIDGNAWTSKHGMLGTGSRLNITLCQDFPGLSQGPCCRFIALFNWNAQIVRKQETKVQNVSHVLHSAWHNGSPIHDWVPLGAATTQIKIK